ncbi:hypothetical protein CC86DRAFT_458446 [Ophiobolus disseminans]|uniref:Tc1-like transposase DDE domain-containing protein n=1 Tax=Ophiobolus disseminans TaxID=1469910 RepID=A0A6A6ZNI8_9PLEO|nr:hypothetical protein CC86DRAFT_458446 [Ophiobolus disseminans]
MYEAGYSRRKPDGNPPFPELRRESVFTRIGEQQGIIRTWARPDEIFDDDIKKDRKPMGAALQFFGAFRYNKGPCHVYYHETQEEIAAGEVALKFENDVTRAQSNSSQITARRALQVLNEADVNLRRSTRKLQHVKKHDYHRGIQTRGGVDGYRHREGALKKVVPWVQDMKKRGLKCVLLEDGAPPHKSRIANNYLTVEKVEKMAWAGHSPDVNASEHAWPVLRRHVTKQFTPTRTAEETEAQWVKAWDALSIERINKWVEQVPEVVRRIIRSGGKNNFHG